MTLLDILVWGWNEKLWFRLVVIAHCIGFAYIIPTMIWTEVVMGGTAKMRKQIERR